MKRIVLSVVLMLAIAPAAMAQGLSDSASNLGATFAPRVTQGAPRSGFTILVNLGVGVQRDDCCAATTTGLAGANLGIGAFVTDTIAVLGRFSGTNVSHGFGDQTSGVLGGTVQVWVSDRFAIEGGAGMGYWSLGSGLSEVGFGIIVGATGIIISRGNHNLIAGVEYAPAFTDPATVHNFGFTIGYQFIRR
jgi:hypothetical protein